MANCLYRITSNGKGIYEAIKDQMGQDEWHDFLNSNITNWLPNPGDNLYKNYDCITFFTEEGFTKFRKTVIPLIERILPIDIDIVRDTDINMLYSDRYQKVFKKGAF